MDGSADTEDVTPTANTTDPEAWGVFAATAVRLWGENSAFHDLLVSAPVAFREAAACTGRVPTTLQRLLAKDPEDAVRGRIARLADDADLLDELADDPSTDVQSETANNFYTAQSTRRRMLSEGNDSVKMRVITSSATDASVIEDFLDEVCEAADGLPWAMRIARFCPNLVGDLLQRLLNHSDASVRQGLADNECDYPGKAEAVELLSRDQSSSVRTELVMTYGTPAETVNRMCNEERDPALRYGSSAMPTGYGTQPSTRCWPIRACRSPCATCMLGSDPCPRDWSLVDLSRGLTARPPTRANWGAEPHVSPPPAKACPLPGTSRGKGRASSAQPACRF